MPAEPNAPSNGGAYRAWFQCIAGCPGQYSLNTVIYRCPRCGNLLEVRHDLEPLRQRAPRDWKDLLDRRYLRTQWPYGSGVWGKREWVCPGVADENVVSTFEGGTNLFWAERLGNGIGVPDLWIKQCGNSHTGSFKDLGMTVLVSMVKQMIAEGKDIPAVACASTGDTSASLAAYCAVAGLQAIVFPAQGQGIQRPAYPAHRARRPDAVAGHRLRRLHGTGAGRLLAPQHLPRQLDELAAHRGPEDHQHGAGAAVRLGGAGLGDHPGRQPRQRERPGQGLRDAAGAGIDFQAAAPLPARRRSGPIRCTRAT